MKAVKMSAHGNDFILFDLRKLDNPQLVFKKICNDALKICNRRFSIGCDQIIALSHINLLNGKDVAKNSTAVITFINSDGSVSGSCGNGTRCAAIYISKKDNILGNCNIIFQTQDRMLECKYNAQTNIVSVNMGKIYTAPEQIPIASNITIDMAKKAVEDAIKPPHRQRIIDIFFGNIGNPHCVIEMNDSNIITLNEMAELYGYGIEHHKTFPERINVEFCTINDSGLHFAVWERGCGITLSCGTGACVAGYYAMQKTGLNAINVYTKGYNDDASLFGSKNSLPLNISLDSNKNIWMEGSGRFIAEIDLDE